MELRLVIYFYLNGLVAAQSDPCVTYRTLNDTSFRTDSGSLALQSSCGLFPPPPFQQWFRFTSTPGGEIATQCPLNSRCGAQNQLWINDTLPSYFDGEKSVRTCLHSTSDCCASGSNIVVKNCNGFFVFKVNIVPACSRFCINATASIPPTVTTTQRVTSMARSTVSKRNGTTRRTTMKQIDITETTTTTFMHSARSTVQTVGLQTTTTNTASKGEHVQTSPIKIPRKRKDHSTPPPSEHSNTALIVGSIVGAVFGLAVIVTVSYWRYRKNHKNHEYRTKPAYEAHYDVPKGKGIDFVSNKKIKISSISPQEN